MPRARVDFVLLTALEEEREALLRRLPPLVKLPPSAADVLVYHAGDLPFSFSDGRVASYRVVVLSVGGMGRVKAADVAAAAINRWRPRFMVLVGIAGGIASAGVALGDVLIADQFVDYELQKLKSDGPSRRYEVYPADARLLAAASNLEQKWRELVKTPRPEEGEPARFIGPIATGDKVIAAAGALHEHLREWPKLIGVEMEAGGAARVAHTSARKPGFFMIRSVSDLADSAQEAPATRIWRSYACDVAAAYAVGLLRSGPVPLKGNRTRAAGSPRIGVHSQAHERPELEAAARAYLTQTPSVDLQASVPSRLSLPQSGSPPSASRSQPVSVDVTLRIAADASRPPSASEIERLKRLLDALVERRETDEVFAAGEDRRALVEYTANDMGSSIRRGLSNLDLQSVFETAGRLGAWLEDHGAILQQSVRAELYELLSNVEVAKFKSSGRNRPSPNLDRARHFLRRARDVSSEE
jgi:nucleoside phosphorylase